MHFCLSGLMGASVELEVTAGGGDAPRWFRGCTWTPGRGRPQRRGSAVQYRLCTAVSRVSEQKQSPVRGYSAVIW